MPQESRFRIPLKKPLDPSYLPVAWEYREVIEAAIEKKLSGKIFYFCKEEGICEVAGRIVRLEDVAGEGLFAVLDNGSRVRADRVITLFGKPGAAYDDYNAYGNACMDCLGGYDPDEL